MVVHVAVHLGMYDPKAGPPRASLMRPNLVKMLGLAFFTVLAYPTNLPWWAFLLAVLISFVFSLPVGIIQAVTNTQIGLNVLTEFIFGYLQPGRPLALML